MRHALTLATAAVLVLTSAVVAGAQDRPQRPTPPPGPGPTAAGRRRAPVATGGSRAL